MQIMRVCDRIPERQSDGEDGQGENEAARVNEPIDVSADVIHDRRDRRWLAIILFRRSPRPGGGFGSSAPRLGSYAEAVLVNYAPRQCARHSTRG